ncbi:transcriptional regulator with XRE-family HTH domain [Kitasatospora gansuensis]|uniref:Transcriptional regulator with XRE-family HTH domain n=1 Tax=Kitasatospora gansuensis TaxID=258050 RepID=A0A7W7SFF8_9ACTN|nr:helix-turn-helix transcriptional regulator [Kitasatospora gansuensis]MBB4949488.1 transcriptional regulator with XRE-family HTH domain [Kitasatospora gansuensis]
MAHKPSCAARIRERAAASSWTVTDTVAEIAACCGVSLLRAHRLARGWTLRQAVAELVQLCERLGLPLPGVDEDQLAAWEKGRRPRVGTVDLLCRLYETNAQGLGVAGDYRAEAGPATAGTARPGIGSLSLPRQVVPVAAPDPFGDLVDTFRRTVEGTLASTTASATQLEVLDEQVMDLRRAYIVSPPTEMLGRLVRILEEVRLLAADRQPATVQSRLSEMIAVLATLVADALMKLGRLDQSRLWYGTARSAADDSGSGDLRARVRVQAAMLPYYYGPLERAVALTREARLLNRGRATVTGAFAAAAEARARARQGDAEGAREAIVQARELFERCPPSDETDAWAFPRRRLLFYLSGAHTALGDLREARRVQQEALALYVGDSGIDPALLALEEAMCLVQERSVTEACELAAHTFLTVPEEYRTEILGVRAQEVIAILPAQVRSSRAVRDLGELLALPTSRM